MLQEIITYIIIAVAVAIAIRKMYKKLSGKKKKVTSYRKPASSVLHNCSDCIASDCSIRDAVPAVKNKKKEVCDTNVKLVKDG